MLVCTIRAHGKQLKQ